LRYWIKSSFVDLDGWKNGWFWFVWSGQGLKKSPIGQKLDFANHPYLCKGRLEIRSFYGYR
jgi:hypothetical protein